MFMVLLWGIGVPGICLVLFKRHKKTLVNLSKWSARRSQIGPLRALDFLFVHYQPHLWYFEVLQFAKKLFLICICPAIIGAGNIESVLVAIIFLAMWLLFCARVRPYMANSDQILAQSLDPRANNALSGL